MALFIFSFSISSYAQNFADEVEIDPQRSYFSQFYGNLVDVFLWKNFNLHRPYYTSSAEWHLFCQKLNENTYAEICRDIRDLTLGLEGAITDWVQEKTQTSFYTWELSKEWKSGKIPDSDKDFLAIIDMIYKGKAPEWSKICVNKINCELDIQLSEDRKKVISLNLRPNLQEISKIFSELQEKEENLILDLN